VRTFVPQNKNKTFSEPNTSAEATQGMKERMFVVG